ncbi:MAG: GspH/FimT family pseudopilin [Rhodospirillales bacterium]|nr:GspH/FimT family pseudopilin [Rhodospirillales bacterium]
MPKGAPARIRTSPTGDSGRAGVAAGGFTLLEILVVLVILAIIAGYAGTRMVGSTERSSVTAATAALAADLRRARSEAIAHNAPAAVRVDVAVPSFGIPGGRTYRVPDGIKLTLFTAATDQTTSSAGQIRFFPDGSSTGGEVTFAGERVREYVQIDWLTGRITVYDDADR